MPLLGVGYVNWHIYQPPTPPFKKNILLQTTGGGGKEWALVPLIGLAMPVTVVQPGFVNRGPLKQRNEATERGKVFPPSHGRKIFLKIRV